MKFNKETELLRKIQDEMILEMKKLNKSKNIKDLTC